MKILMMSDSHLLEGFDAVVYHEKPDISIHLGDSQLMANCLEMEQFDYLVRGNCDYESYPEMSKVQVGEKSWLLCHGHQIKNIHNIQAVAKFAKAHNCEVLCHGHTHVPRACKVDGVTIINPGSFANSRCEYPNSYMMIEVDENSIVAHLKKTSGELIKEFLINE